MAADDKEILLVEDDVLIAMLEKLELERFGYTVTHVTNGEEAIRLALNSDNHFNVILMDIDLGSGIDGTQAAQTILGKLDIPIVFLSSHTELEIVQKTEKIASYGYVIKNSGIVVLDMSIRMALKLFREKMDRRRAEKYQLLSASILAVLNEPLTLRETSNAILDLIRKETGMDAVGIRLKDGDDFPYFSENGLDDEFLLAENSVILRSDTGGVCRDENGQISLQCTCGMVLSEKCGPPSDSVTAAGSVWTNDSRAMLELLEGGNDTRLKPRNRCIHEGFMSVALIPIRADHRVVGLLHLNDRRKGRFSPEIIRYFEGLTASFGISVERKRAEEEIKRQLAEKELLLMEVHHRIKNNLANLESLLSLQINATDSTDVKAALQESAGRLHSFRVLYDKILLAKDYQDVALKPYLEGLIDHVAAVYAAAKNITIDKRIADFSITSKNAVAVGIILNELLTNVFKYAFADRQKGIVSITLSNDENGAELIIQDNGIGIDDGVFSGNSSGLGLLIVRMLVEQLKGTYRLMNDNGTKSVIKFKI